jgi:hypothetical protein
MQAASCVRPVILAAVIAPLIALCACEGEDPAMVQRAAAQRRIDDSANKLASIAAQASGDLKAAADQLRSLSNQIQSVPGASPGQQAAAAGVAAGAARQAGLLETAHARRLEASNARARALAVRLASIAALAQADADAHGGASSRSAGAVPSLADAQELASQASQALSEIDEALDDARMRAEEASEAMASASADADALRIEALSADPRRAHRLIEQSATRREVAREAMERVQTAEVETARGESLHRMVELEALCAKRQADALAAALDSLADLNRSFSSRRSGASETVRTMQVRVKELLDSSDPAAHEAFNESIRLAIEDFERSASLSQRATPSGGDRSAQASGAMARASSEMSRALVHRTHSDANLSHARALLAVAMAPGAAGDRAVMQQAQDSLAKATDSHAKAAEAYTSAQESLGRSGDSVPVRELRASLTASLGALSAPSLDIPKSPDAPARSPDSGAGRARAAAAAPSAPVEVTDPPHSTPEALVAYLSSGRMAKSPEAMRDVMVGKRPTAKPFLDSMIAMNGALARYEQAMEASFGKGGSGLASTLGAATAIGGPGSEFTLISVDGETGVIGQKGAMGPAAQLTIRLDGGAWKIDLDEVVMKAGPMGQMLPGLVGSFVPAIDDVTDAIKGGQIASAAEAQRALQAAMQDAMAQAMGGGMGGPR